MWPTLLAPGWFVRLRWAFAAVQGALVAASALGLLTWEAAQMAVALVVGSASNAALDVAARRGRAGERAVLAALVLDAALLTTFLDAAGGASSALVPLYLVPPGMMGHSGVVSCQRRWVSAAGRATTSPTPRSQCSLPSSTYTRLHTSAPGRLMPRSVPPPRRKYIGVCRSLLAPA